MISKHLIPSSGCSSFYFFEFQFFSKIRLKTRVKPPPRTPGTPFFNFFSFFSFFFHFFSFFFIFFSFFFHFYIFFSFFHFFFIFFHCVTFFHFFLLFDKKKQILLNLFSNIIHKASEASPPKTMPIWTMFKLSLSYIISNLYYKKSWQNHYIFCRGALWTIITHCFSS